MTRIFNDTTMNAIEFALRATGERQTTTANNIANMNTAGFTASRVRFEEELSQALSTGRSVEDLGIRRVAADTPIGVNGNNVALEEETQELVTSGLQYEALVNALNSKLTVLRTAIRGG